MVPRYKPVFTFFINSSLFLAIASICALDSYSIFYPNINTAIFPIVFFGTLLVYNSHKVAKFTFHQYTPGSPKHLWVKNNILYLKILVIVSACALLYYIPEISAKTILYSAAPALLAVMYSAKVIPAGRRKPFALRDIPYAKGIFVAMVWSYITVLFPQVFQTGDIFWSNPWVWIFFIGRFLLFFILTGLSDIRDLPSDHPALHTLPQVIGIQRTKVLYYFLLLPVALSGYLCWWKGFLPAHLLVAFYLGHLLLAFLIYKADEHRRENFYTVFVDGILIVQWLLAVLLSL